MGRLAPFTRLFIIEEGNKRLRTQTMPFALGTKEVQINKNK